MTSVSDSESVRLAVAQESARRACPQPVGGRHGVLIVVLAAIAAGHGWPSPAQIAAAMGWRNERSARDALARLERDGLIRRAGRSTAWGRPQEWEITAKGTAPTSAWNFAPRPRERSLAVPSPVSDGGCGMHVNGPDKGVDVATSLSSTSSIICRAA